MNGVDWLNSLAPDRAEAEFLKCCGSKNWAVSMTARRPYANPSELLSQADETWRSLTPADWLEAFRSHPKIGEQKAAQAQSATAKAWSEQEQAGTRNSDRETMLTLADANQEYATRFGYIFIVCATGKTAAEMLEILQNRLHNQPQDELRIAADEQGKITELRLRKLVFGRGS
jgi:OHCU decarboxylase